MKTLRMALVGVLAVCVLGLIWFELGAKEPVYQGRRLSQWLDDYNKAGTTNKFGPIDGAIRAMGTNCLPFLLANVSHEDSQLKREFWRVMKRLPVVKFSAYGEDSLLNPSIIALHALGDQAGPILPVLAKRVREPGPFMSTEAPLLAIGTNAVPIFERLCRSTNRDMRLHAAFDIAQLNADLTVDCRWDNALVNGKPLARVWFWSASRAKHRGTLARLIREETNSAVRIAAVEAALWWYDGTNTQPDETNDELNQALADSTKDPDPAVRRAAAEATPDPPKNPSDLSR